MQIRRRGVGKNHGWKPVVGTQPMNSLKWDATAGEISIVTAASRDPTSDSEYFHEVRLTLSDFVGLVRLVAGEGIKGSPREVRDAVKSTIGGGEPAESLLKLLCCSSGYIPTVLPGAVAVKSSS